MRNLFATGMFAALLALTSCTPDDSIHHATEQSVQRFEEAGIQNMENDALFLAEVTSANMLQLQLSEMAANQAVSPEVRELAQQMQNEHRQVLDEINTVGAEGNFILPAKLGKKHQETYNEISSRSGLPFDLAYIEEAVESHKDLLKRYEDMADNGVSMNIKQFASKQVPLARQHLETAQALEKQVSDY